MKGVAAVYSYSHTKGLFGGVSVEGSILVEQRCDNKKLYDRKVKARQLLRKDIRPPPEADPLMRILNSPAFTPPFSLGLPADMPRQMSHLETPLKLPNELPTEVHRGMPHKLPAEAPPRSDGQPDQPPQVALSSSVGREGFVEQQV